MFLVVKNWYYTFFNRIIYWWVGALWELFVIITTDPDLVTVQMLFTDIFTSVYHALVQWSEQQSGFWKNLFDIGYLITEEYHFKTDCT